MCNPYSGLDRPADALELARLLREVFEPLDVRVGNGATACLDSLSGGELLFGGKKIQAPQVQILEPSEGGVVSSRPTFKVEISAGEASQSVSVQVNRQQGKQSWLKLGTQTLANLGRTTLMGSVSYALLPGVHWLASLGEPAVGEKVALEG